MAERAEAPILAEDAVLDKAGLLIERETSQAIPQETPEGENVGEDELKRMSPFTDFVNTLHVDNLGERRQGNE